MSTATVSRYTLPPAPAPDKLAGAAASPTRETEGESIEAAPSSPGLEPACEGSKEPLPI